MKSGYDQFFKAARKASQKAQPKNAAKMQDEPQFNLHAAGVNSENLRNEVEKQLRQRVGVKAKKRKKVNWKLATLSFIGLLVCLWAVANHDKVETFVQSLEVSMLGQAQAETKSTPETSSTPANETKAEASAAAKEEAAAKENLNSEDLDHLQKLVQRKKQLDDREAELNRVEEEIARQKVEVEKRMKELEEMRNKISSILEDKVKVDETKVDSLMQMYSNMKPPQAAKVFETMDEDLAVDILGRMKKKNAADILNLLKAEKAQAISEKFAGYKRLPAQAKSEGSNNNNNNKEVKP